MSANAQYAMVTGRVSLCLARACILSMPSSSVSEELYAAMGEALIFALGQRLGDDRFSPEAAQAWSKAYGFISATMVTFSKQDAGRSCVIM